MDQNITLMAYVGLKEAMGNLASYSGSAGYIAVDQIHESTTNPRQTFDQSKLEELAESIRQHGLIQPVTVQPNASSFEIVAGARRFPRFAACGALLHRRPHR